MIDYDAELKALLADKVPPLPLDQPCAGEQRNVILSAQGVGVQCGGAGRSAVARTRAVLVDYYDLVERAGAAEFCCAVAIAVAISAAAIWWQR